LDDDRLAGPDGGGVAGLQLLPLSVRAPHPILADLSGLAAGEPEQMVS
jgi:hypothetical protein